MNKKKLCVFTLYCKEGASSNYRILMYLDSLKQKYDVQEFSFWNNTYVSKYMLNKKKYLFSIIIQYMLNVLKRLFQILCVAPRYEVIVFQKGVIPALPFLFTDYLHKRGCKIIVDVDDAIYLSRHDYTDELAKKADIFVVGNHSLEEHYKKFCRKVVIIPTVDFSPGYTKYIHNTFAEKCIGWIGSKSTINNLNIVVNAINKVIEKHPEVRMKIICNDDYGFLKKIKYLEFVPWTIGNYKKDMSSFTIGIMPLYDTTYNKGKCGFKLIQYMNLHKPVIASPVGINKEIVGKCGFIAQSEDEWVEALESLLYDEEIYTSCKNHIETDFESNYSYNKALEMWFEILKKV